MSQLSNRVSKLEKQKQEKSARCPKCENIMVKTIVRYEDEEIAEGERFCECGRVFFLMILTIEREPRAA